MAEPITPCPICSRIITNYPALSRTDNKTKICSACGRDEALAGVKKGDPLGDYVKANPKTGIFAPPIKCYGCGKKAPLGMRMRVEYERKKQTFCKPCSERLVKIKMERTGGL